MNLLERLWNRHGREALDCAVVAILVFVVVLGYQEVDFRSAARAFSTWQSTDRMGTRDSLWLARLDSLPASISWEQWSRTDSVLRPEPGEGDGLTLVGEGSWQELTTRWSALEWTLRDAAPDSVHLLWKGNASPLRIRLRVGRLP